MEDNKDVLDQEVVETTDELVAENESENTENATNEAASAKSENEVSELKDKYLRLMAEFENFKRRSSKERIELIGTASKEMIVALLPILDDFERADKNGGLSEGTTLIYHKLTNTLTSKGLKAMDSDNADFNAEHHEAITEIPLGEDKKGKVIETVEKGYFLNDKIIRYAKVVVGA